MVINHIPLFFLVSCVQSPIFFEEFIYLTWCQHGNKIAKFGLKENVVQARDFDVDGCLLRFKKPGVMLEVKWEQKINTKEITKNLKRINAKKALLFVPDKRKIKVEDKDIEVVDILDFI